MTVTLAGRYLIERELGRGGMATVYLADDVMLHRRVALKVLHSELAATLGRDRFLREVAIAGGLTHPHILQLHDSGEIDGHLYYAMPYVDGESLRQRLERESQLPVAEVIAIVRMVAGALAYAHSRGVVHRDIKPENILLACGGAAGGPPLPLVADFGIARAVDASGGERLTETGLALGTPAYMSPEQAAGGGRLDGRSDIYALGCVAYEMLAGAPPFTGSTAQAIMARHAVDPVPRLRTVRTSIPPAVELAVERALAKVPADRFATADEFGDALLAKGPSWVLRARGIHFRRARNFLGVAAAAALGVGAFLLRGSAAPATSAVIPSATAIAVLPFRSPTGDTALTRLGRDLATTVSASLDGVGGIETADRLSVASATRDMPLRSPGEEAALANRLGARSVLRGSLVQDGSTVRVDVGLYDTRNLDPVAKGITVAGHRDSVRALTDSVVWAVLQRVWQRGEAPSPSLAAVTTRSIPALRAFLDGERLFDQDSIGEAALAYSSAMTADSGFALAYFRYAFARSWFVDQTVESEVIEALRRQSHTLPERERLMAQAFLADTLERSVEGLREVTRRFPNHWPGWFLLGDLFIHNAPLGGYDWTEGLEAFRRVVEIHPRMTTAWQHIFTTANGRRQPLTDSAMARLRELGWPWAQNPRVRLVHGLGRSGGIMDPDLSGPADSLVREYLRAPDQYGTRYGSFALGLLQEGFPAAQVALSRRALERMGASSRRISNQVGIAWATAARGSWDSAIAAMTKAAEMNPGTYVPRRFAQFGDPVLAMENYGLAVLGAWLGATSPDVADPHRPAAIAAIDLLPDDSTRAGARARIAWFDGLLAFTRGDRKAISTAGGAAARSGYSQSAMVERSLTAFDRALSGNRAAAGRELADLEMGCLASEECSHFTPEMAVQRLAAAQWLQEAGDVERAVRLLRWKDALIADEMGTLYTIGHVLAGPTFIARARLEELRGDRRRAAEYYRRFLQVYDQPMPSQVHLVGEASSALARLDAETPGPDP
jgi:tRNA A-37 threonylcarbamoyl transferase component Bud32/TolB-like protein/tetratricopeptide (TPR) repeat protein